MTSTKTRYSISDLLISKKINENVIREDFSDLVPITVEDCEDSTIFILSALAQCTVDYCSNSFIFIGPCEGSVFLRNCSNCVIVTASQQLRLRDCCNLQISVFCSGQPIIETSKGITFSCFSYWYSRLYGNVLNNQDQFEMANLNIFKNDWINVYDFNPASGNFSISATPLKDVKRPDEQLGIERSTVPLTTPKSYLDKDIKYSLLLIFATQRDTYIWLQHAGLIPLMTNYHSFSQINVESLYPPEILGSCKAKTHGISLLFSAPQECPLDHASCLYDFADNYLVF